MFIILINGDSTVTDTVAIDSVVVYEIPEIINFQMCDTLLPSRISCSEEDIILTGHSQNLVDALYFTPFMLHIYGYGQLNLIAHKGLDPKHTMLFLNGHKLDNPIFGYFNVTTLPVQIFESISIGGDMMTSAPNSINMISRVNHYDRPFSLVNYTFGDFGTNIYNIDFTRPITNDFGFYLSGLYREYEGYRGNDDFKIGSFYTNIYYNRFFPMRLDIVYFSDDYEIAGSTLDTLYGRGKDKFIDVCFVYGAGNHKIAIYHTLVNAEYTDPFASTSSIRNYGFHTRSYHTFNNLGLSYGLMGQRSLIETDLYGSHAINSMALWLQCNKSFENFFLSVASRGEWISNYDFFYLPKVSFGVDIFDSTYLTGTVSRSFRAPSLSETYESPEVIYPYYRIKGNIDILPEYYWLQELAIKRKNIELNFYKYDFTNRIVTHLDSVGYYIPENINPWQTIGVEGYLELPFYFNGNTDGKSSTEISVGFSGNYLFKGDSLPLVPKGISSFFLSIKRKTERLSLGLLIKERFVGIRHDISGQRLTSFRVFSTAGTIKFISLSCTLNIDNIFDESYAYIANYPMAPRSFSLSIKWEFWD